MRLFALTFVLGAAFLQRQPALPEYSFASLGLAALLACALVSRRWIILRTALVLAAGVLTGFGYAAWRAESRLADALPVEAEGRDFEVTGIVDGLPQVTEKGTRFVFRVETPKQSPTPTTISLGWYADRNTVMPKVVPCERWRFTVRLKRPRGLANPHPIASFLLRFPAGEEGEGVEPPPNPLGVPPGLPGVPGETAGA